jgi:putative addiction module killer protein
VIIPRELRAYRTSSGRSPFSVWLQELRDLQGKEAIVKRLDRLSLGNPGDAACLSGGVWELRIHVGPGYRVYYGHEGNSIVILLCGGDKSSQKRDIRKALSYWEDYSRRT